MCMDNNASDQLSVDCICSQITATTLPDSLPCIIRNYNGSKIVFCLSLTLHYSTHL